MTYSATESTPLGAQWPQGLHWSAGEVRTIPDGYPVEGDPPGWLVLVEDAPAPPKKATRLRPAGG